MMPMLRVSESLYLGLAMLVPYLNLPTIVRERAVGLGHLEDVHTLLDGSESVAALGLLGNDLESGVDDALSGGLLAVKKDLVDELSHQAVVVNGVRLNLTTISCCTAKVSKRYLAYLALGRLAPYLERACIRFWTGAAS